MWFEFQSSVYSKFSCESFAALGLGLRLGGHNFLCLRVLYLHLKDTSPAPSRLLCARPVKLGDFSTRVSRRLYAGGGSCLRNLWRAWRIRECRSA